eukprot:scaffold72156_cov78-Phaeocystis_antarctica.AAC.1
MLRNLRTRFRRKDTDATRVLAITNSIHSSPWHTAPTIQQVTTMTASTHGPCSVRGLQLAVCSIAGRRPHRTRVTASTVCHARAPKSDGLLNHIT